MYYRVIHFVPPIYINRHGFISRIEVLKVSRATGMVLEGFQFIGEN